MNRYVWVIQTGQTFESLAREKGDFDAWILRGLGLPRSRTRVMRVYLGDPLPAWERVAGVVLSGSHAMVTERLSWSETLAAWLAGAAQTQIPILGICYGHQLLAHALGGEVRNNSHGSEFGTVDIATLPAARKDALFSGLPPVFKAHVCHTQSAIRLPSGAAVLAASSREAHQAFALQGHIWGLQFHPEFDAEAAAAYLRNCSEQLAAEGQPLDKLLQDVCKTPFSALLLRRFAELCDAS